MSYRHSSYRKLKKARAGGDALMAGSPRTYPLRVLHWEGRPTPPRPEGWGKPKKKVG